jgi:transposase-like protein
MAPRDLKRVFDRNRGAMAAIARELGITNQSVYDWFKLRRSKRVEKAIRARAVELLAAEERLRAEEAANESAA